jgi:hypothetical protein
MIDPCEGEDLEVYLTAARRQNHHWSVLHLPSQKTISSLPLQFDAICRMLQEPFGSYDFSENEPLKKEL